jgi:hypothetical protein
LPKKSQKLGNFEHKKAPQYYKGNFGTSQLISLAFFGVFSCQTAMLLLPGILFGTFAVLLVGNFPKLTKTGFFTEVLVFAERPVGSYCPILTFS